MKETMKYVVIGGQYECYDYGTTESLHAAKLLATKNEEHWDNWQGWHTPKIYKLSDCEIGNGQFFGENYHPITPCECWEKRDGKWRHYDAWGDEIA